MIEINIISPRTTPENIEEDLLEFLIERNWNITTAFYDFKFETAKNRKEWKKNLIGFKNTFENIKKEKYASFTDLDTNFSWKSLDRIIKEDNNRDFEHSFEFENNEPYCGVSLRRFLLSGDIFEKDLFEKLITEYQADYVNEKPINEILFTQDIFSRNSLHIIAFNIAQRIQHGQPFDHCWTIYHGIVNLAPGIEKVEDSLGETAADYIINEGINVHGNVL